MLYSAIILIIILYTLYDVNYWIRTFFTLLCGRLQCKRFGLNDATTIYGLSTFHDGDVTFRYIREARLLRELDFARYHFYDRTGIYSLNLRRQTMLFQGSTMTLHLEPVPLFAFYKINTKLVYWDNKSLYFEHEIITLHDGKVRAFFVSNQQCANGGDRDTMAALLQGLPGSERKQECPEYLEHWFRSMDKSSATLRKNENI